MLVRRDTPEQLGNMTNLSQIEYEQIIRQLLCEDEELELLSRLCGFDENFENQYELELSIQTELSEGIPSTSLEIDYLLSQNYITNDEENFNYLVLLSIQMGHVEEWE